MKTSFLVLVVLLLAAAPASARDLPALTPDPGGLTFWDDVTVIAGNGSRTFVAGEFTALGTLVPSGAVVSGRTGRLQTLAGAGWIRSAVADGTGGWYTGISTGIVHRLRADGSLDPAFVSPALEADVRTLALSPDRRTLWVGGAFGIRALDAASGRALPWSTGAVMLPWDLTTDGSTLYAAGNGYDGDETARSVVALDASTGAVRAWGPPGIGPALALGAGELYVGLYGAYAVALDPVTLAERWRARANQELNDVALTPDGRKLFVTDQARIGGPAVMVFDTASGARLPFDAPITTAGEIAISPDGETAYLGRAKATGWPLQGAIAFSTRDGALLGWAPGTESRTSVGALAVSPDGAGVLLDGAPLAGSRPRAGAAILDETGEPTRFNDPGDSLTPVLDAALDAASTAYISRRAVVSAVEPDGTLRWRLVLDHEGAAVELAPDGGTLFVTGSFTRIGGVERLGFAAVRTADGAVIPWPLSVSGGNVERTVFSPDGQTLYLAGSFTAVNGVPRAGLAAVDAATGAVRPFDFAMGGRATTMAVSPGGQILFIGGEFGPHNAPTYLLGLRTSDGAIVFRPQFWSEPDALAPLADGQTLIVGREGLTAWDVSTGDRLDWRVDPCSNCGIDALELSPDGRTLHVGGRFALGGREYHYARLAVNRVPSPVTNTTPPHVVGLAAPGSFVECDPGAWAGSPTAYTFTWTLDGTPVAEFEGREFLLEPADTGHALRCVVRAGGATATSGPVTVAGEPVLLARRLAGSPGGGTPTPTPSPTPTATPTPTPSPTASPSTTPTAGAEPSVEPAPGAGPMLPPQSSERSGPPAAPPDGAVTDPARVADRTPPRVTLARGAPVRVTLSERASVTASLRRGARTVTRRFALPAGRHTLTARRLSGRAKLAPGRYTLTLRARDRAGNTARRVLRFTV